MGVGHDSVFRWRYDTTAKTSSQGEHAQLKCYPALVGCRPVARVCLVICFPINEICLFLIRLFVFLGGEL